MRLPLIVASVLILSACSTTQPTPRRIDPPPVALVTRCAEPLALPSEATVRDLAEFAVEWIGVARCERVKRQALLASWPE